MLKCFLDEKPYLKRMEMNVGDRFKPALRCFLLTLGLQSFVLASFPIPQIENPAKPKLGTIVLDVERILKINPYDFSDFGMRSYSFLRNEDGSVIFFDANRAVVHRFGARGENLGPLSRLGQGPGELTQTVKPLFLDGRILLSSGRRIIEFDSSGKMISERPADPRPEFMIDDARYLAVRRERGAFGGNAPLCLSIITLARANVPSGDPLDVFGPIIPGVLRKNGLGFIDSWGTPNLCYGYDPVRRLIYAAMNREYRISVFDLSGKLVRIIGKRHIPVKRNIEDVEAAYFASNAVQPGSAKEIAEIYPKTYAAIKKIEILKNGYVLVFRIAGMRNLEVDVFDLEGVYVYALQPPLGLSFEYASFHDGGFAATELEGDFRVYSDFRVKNLPKIFN
jgi:hypothetical protein